jgi:hypothetical protein
MFQLAPPGMAVFQGLRIHVNDDLLAVSAREFLRAGGQKALRDQSEGLDPAFATIVYLIQRRFRGRAYPVGFGRHKM